MVSNSVLESELEDIRRAVLGDPNRTCLTLGKEKVGRSTVLPFVKIMLDTAMRNNRYVRRVRMLVLKDNPEYIAELIGMLVDIPGEQLHPLRSLDLLHCETLAPQLGVWLGNVFNNNLCNSG